MYHHARGNHSHEWNSKIDNDAYKYSLGSPRVLVLRFDEKFANDKDDISRIIGYAHPYLMDIAKDRKRNMFVDCTFQVVPKPFSQLMVVMFYYPPKNHYVPVFYILLPDKKKSTYIAAFEQVKKLCGGDHFDLETLTCDFEKAMIKAANDVFFPHIKNAEDLKYVLCLFHWKQAIRRRLVKLKFSDKHITKLIGKWEFIELLNDDGSTTIKQSGLLELLTEIPIEDIDKYGIPFIRKLMEEDELASPNKFNKFWTYFKKTWLEVYNPQCWNIYRFKHNIENRPLEIVNRTNNPLERYNKHLNGKIKSHPKMLPFIDALREEIQHQYLKLEMIKKNQKVSNTTRCPSTIIVPTQYDTFKEACNIAPTTDDDKRTDYTHLLDK